jgi:hypothetical protein
MSKKSDLEHKDDVANEEKFRELVEKLSGIIGDTDKIVCPRKTGHIKYVKACLVYCSKINRNIEKCEPLHKYLQRRILLEERIVNRAIDLVKGSKENKENVTEKKE